MSNSIIIMVGMYFIILGVVCTLVKPTNRKDVTEDERHKMKIINVITGIFFILVGSSFIIWL
ncbi:hypothetical protein COM61_02325 [Bacillus toyonensis]|nr:hypothetical protein COM61_02325 [Bacillus toyonensis]